MALHYGHSAEAARETVAGIVSRGGRAVPVQADFREPATAAQQVIDETVREFGRVDILVNSAAIFEAATLAETTAEQWDRHMAINLQTPYFLCQRFAGVLQDDRRGHIVNIADWRATRPVPGHLPYTLTKSGLVTLTQILARELAPRVQVNAIAPGAVLAPPGEDDAYLERVANRIPLRRTGTVGEVTETLLFLLRSDFVTGEILHVTGGEHLADG